MKIIVLLTGGLELDTVELEKQSGYQRAMVNRVLGDLEKSGQVVQVRSARGNKAAVWRLA